MMSLQHPIANMRCQWIIAVPPGGCQRNHAVVPNQASVWTSGLMRCWQGGGVSPQHDHASQEYADNQESQALADDLGQIHSVRGQIHSVADHGLDSACELCYALHGSGFFYACCVIK